MKSEPSHSEILASPIRAQSCEEEKKENDDHSIEHVRGITRPPSPIIGSIILQDTHHRAPLDMNSPGLPELSSFASIEIPTCLSKDLDDRRDDSFLTQDTVSVSDSEDGTDSCNCISNEDGDSDSEGDIDSCICIMSRDRDDSSCVCLMSRDRDDCSQCSTATSVSRQSFGVRFADEVGLPIQSIQYYECDRTQREHAELLVLCICPQKKTFEFLHVGYHRHQEKNASVRDLLDGLPGMCTNPFFANAKFVALYRNNYVKNAFENLCSPSSKQTCTVDNESSNSIESNNDVRHLSLRDCNFRENEVVVAAIEGSSEVAVLKGIGPLLTNKKILETLKRARRSRRGLKFVFGENGDKDSLYHRRKSLGLSLRRRRAKKENKAPDEKHPNAVPKMEAECSELVDEYCHDYDPLYDVAQYHKQLLLGILAVGSGTVVFSALGL